MSMESATKFYETMEKDTDLQKKIGEMKDKNEIENQVKGVLGYDFSQEEMEKVLFEKNPELTDEELEAVVGGGVHLLSAQPGGAATGVAASSIPMGLNAMFAAA